MDIKLLFHSHQLIKHACIVRSKENDWLFSKEICALLVNVEKKEEKKLTKQPLLEIHGYFITISKEYD